MVYFVIYGLDPIGPHAVFCCTVERDCKFVEQAEEPPSYYTGEEVENFPDNSGKPPPYKITAKKQSVSSVNPPPYEFSLNEESDSERAPLSRPPHPPVHSEPECPPVIPSTMFFAPVVYPFPLPVSSYDSRTTEERVRSVPAVQCVFCEHAVNEVFLQYSVYTMNM